jgi:nicotinamidase-related amidase
MISRSKSNIDDNNDKNRVLGRSPVLFVIDVQHDFLDVDGAVPCPATSVSGPREVIHNIRKVVDAAKAVDIPTIFTKEVHRANKIDMGRELDGDESSHCLEGTRGAEIVEELGTNTLAENQFIVTKRRYSAFIGTDLILLLNAFKADTLLLTGATTNVCVHYTGADAHQYDYHIKVIEEATAGTSQSAHEAALEGLEYLQHGARVHLRDVLEAMRTFRSSINYSEINQRVQAHSSS